MKQINVMKRSLVILFSIFSISFLFADENEVLLLPYNTTTLTPEQQAMNPTFVAYPTQLKNSIPQMKCNSELYGFTIDVQGHKVCFSPGNLQYHLVTHKWRFAEHQWDYVGFEGVHSLEGNVFENGVRCSNYYDGSWGPAWIDLFAWATSGWPRDNEYYEPTSNNNVRCNRYKYHINGNGKNSFETGSGYENADWGVYNQIGSDPPNTWRTLSSNQWHCIIYQRPNASSLRAMGTINGVTGLILLPDDWTPIAEVPFVSATNDASQNNYSVSDWSLMEKHGAVFLPCALGRWGYGNENRMGGGFYWSSTPESYNVGYCNIHSTQPLYEYAYSIMFYSGISDIQSTETQHRSYGLAVRLVRDLE